jgi:peptidoglycan/LPS O-acetylase OafA/YrhL
MTKARGIPSMTGIRGVAAVWVMLYHARFYLLDLPFLPRIELFGSGWRGVDLFFMLSGFILMYAHGREFYEIRKGPIIRFARLRFTRVYPLNAVILFLIAVLVAFQPGYVAWLRSVDNPADCSPGAFVRTLLLATRWFLPGRGEWNTPTWSLSLEILGYIAFPLLAYCALRVTRGRQLIGIGLLSLAGDYVVLRVSHTPESDFGQIAVVRMAACFVTGIAICRLWSLAAASAKKWAGWITAASVAGVLIAAYLPHGDVLFNFCFASLLYGLAFQQGIVNKLLASRAAVFLGDISFPLYLVHVVPLVWLWYFIRSDWAAFSPFAKAAAVACWAVGCILAATLLHYFVEKPFHSLGRRWAGERVPR